MSNWFVRHWPELVNDVLRPWRASALVSKRRHKHVMPQWFIEAIFSPFTLINWSVRSWNFTRLNNFLRCYINSLCRQIRTVNHLEENIICGRRPSAVCRISITMPKNYLPNKNNFLEIKIKITRANHF